MESHGSVPRRRRHIRFSLVELLVVITILSILMAMLMPGLHAALGSARSTSCVNNLRQLAVWGNSYADNYNGVLPHNGQQWIGPFNGYDSVSSTGWQDKFRADFGGQSSVDLKCPQAAADLGTSGIYGLNCYMGGCRVQNASNPVIPLKRSKDLRPRAFWWADAGAEKSATGVWTFAPFIWPNSWIPHGLRYHGPYAWTQSGVAGHPGNGVSANFIFGDGHVEAHPSAYYNQIMTIEQKRAFNGGYY